MRRIFTLPPIRGYRVQVKATPGARDSLFQVPGDGIFDTRPTPPPPHQTTDRGVVRSTESQIADYYYK